MRAAFFDAGCPKCGGKIGWIGRISDKPKCPKCGHHDVVTQDEAEAFEAYMNKIAEDKAADDEREWKEATDAQKQFYAEGHDDFYRVLREFAIEGKGVKHPCKFGPLEQPSPYVATRSSDGAFQREGHRWWSWGWKDAADGRDRMLKEPKT